MTLRNDPTGRKGMPVHAGERLRQGQAPSAAGWRGTDLASGRRSFDRHLTREIRRQNPVLADSKRPAATPDRRTTGRPAGAGCRADKHVPGTWNGAGGRGGTGTCQYPGR